MNKGLDTQKIDRWFDSLEARIEKLENDIPSGVGLLDIAKELSTIIKEIRSEPFCSFGDIKDLARDVYNLERKVQRLSKKQYGLKSSLKTKTTTNLDDSKTELVGETKIVESCSMLSLTAGDLRQILSNCECDGDVINITKECLVDGGEIQHYSISKCPNH